MAAEKRDEGCGLSISFLSFFPEQAEKTVPFRSKIAQNRDGEGREELTCRFLEISLCESTQGFESLPLRLTVGWRELIHGFLLLK